MMGDLRSSPASLVSDGSTAGLRLTSPARIVRNAPPPEQWTLVKELNMEKREPCEVKAGKKMFSAASFVYYYCSLIAHRVNIAELPEKLAVFTMRIITMRIITFLADLEVRSEPSTL